MKTTTPTRIAPATAPDTTALPAPDRTGTARVGSYVDRDGVRPASRVGSYVATSHTGSRTGPPAVGGYTDRGRVRTSSRRGSYTDAQR